MRVTLHNMRDVRQTLSIMFALILWQSIFLNANKVFYLMLRPHFNKLNKFDFPFENVLDFLFFHWKFDEFCSFYSNVEATSGGMFQARYSQFFDLSPYILILLHFKWGVPCTISRFWMIDSWNWRVDWTTEFIFGTFRQNAFIKI